MYVLLIEPEWQLYFIVLYMQDFLHFHFEWNLYPVWSIISIIWETFGIETERLIYDNHHTSLKFI